VQRLPGSIAFACACYSIEVKSIQTHVSELSLAQLTSHTWCRKEPQIRNCVANHYRRIRNKSVNQSLVSGEYSEAGRARGSPPLLFLVAHIRKLSWAAKGRQERRGRHKGKQASSDRGLWCANSAPSRAEQSRRTRGMRMASFCKFGFFCFPLLIPLLLIGRSPIATSLLKLLSCFLL
jgi:hypothetical protein